MSANQSCKLTGDSVESRENNNNEHSVRKSKIQRCERNDNWLICSPSNAVLLNPSVGPKSISVVTIDEEEPISLAENDRRHLLTIFSEEVWHLIFKKADTSIDLENLSNSSLYFRQLLAPQQTQFLFQNVWNFLGRAFEHNYLFRKNMYNIVIPYYDMPRIYDNHDKNEQTVGGGEQWYKEILKLRLVCRTWNTAIEIFYENHPLHFQLQNYNDNSYNNVYEFLHANNLSNSPLVDYAHIHNNTTRNPFLGRSIEIFIDRKHNGHFINKIMRVLLQFGHHIWYCSVRIIDIKSMRECYSRIWKILQLMPNLKVLRVEYWGTNSYPVSAEKLEQLQTEIDLRQLPTLKKLQMLSTTNLPHFILHQLIRTNGHVSTLDMDRKKTDYCCCGIFSFPLQNLKTFVAAFDSEHSFMKMNADCVDWPLTELQLNLQSCKPFLDWQKVFNVLGNKFGGTLTSLVLKLPMAIEKADKDKIYLESHTFRLKLPRLTFLNVKAPNLACLDFLLPMRDSLTWLFIAIIITNDDIIGPLKKIDVEEQMELINPKSIGKTLKKVEVENKSAVRLLRCVRHPSKTNMWSLFPNLKNSNLLRILTNEDSHFFSF